MNRCLGLAAAVTLLAGCRLTPEPELQVGTARTRIQEVEDVGKVTIAVSIPVRPNSGGAEFQLTRAGSPVTFDSTPSTALHGGVDLVDESAPFATSLAYQIVAAFPTGETVKKDLSVSLVRSLTAFPTLSLTSGTTTPKFVWSTQGLANATFMLEVTPESASGYSLLFGKGISSYDWRNPASSSAGNQVITPAKLVAGVTYTARVTATAGPAERQEQTVSKAITFRPQSP